MTLCTLIGSTILLRGVGWGGMLLPSFNQADGYRRFGTKHEFPLRWKLQNRCKMLSKKTKVKFSLSTPWRHVGGVEV